MDRTFTTSFLSRAAITLLLALVSSATAWADPTIYIEPSNGGSVEVKNDTKIYVTATSLSDSKTDTNWSNYAVDILPIGSLPYIAADGTTAWCTDYTELTGGDATTLTSDFCRQMIDETKQMQQWIEGHLPATRPSSSSEDTSES
jgi:hypothetical protein